jgi:excinuclease ABC subunit C
MADNLYKNMPETPGVYIMKGAKNEVLYVGKAGNLRRRVSSYFMRPHDLRIQRMVGEIKKIDRIQTETAIEALILEAELIKKYMPPFNIRETDDKSFLYVEITKEKFPRVFIVRGKSEAAGERFGPFTSASSIREALKIIRRIFPFSVHPSEKIGTFKRACFDYEIGLCPGTCVNAISRADYLKNIRNIKLFFKGRRRRLMKNLEKEMGSASKKLEFEKAEIIKRRIFAVQHIQDVAFISDNEIEDKKIIITTPHRIEGYDISNISGDSAVGSMVVFISGVPDKNEYRKFKIKTVVGANDVGMMKEVLRRRFNNPWAKPDLILVDGGGGQVNAAKEILEEVGHKIPIVGIAKGPNRKNDFFVGTVIPNMDKGILVKVRNEAHRFALNYHKKLRSVKFKE